MRRRIWVAAASVAVVALVGAGVWKFAHPARITVHGSVQVTDMQSEQCTGTYNGISRGTQVMVSDQTKFVAFGALDAPSAVKQADPIGATICTFPFVVRDVPAGRGSYHLTIGQHPAGWYHEAELTKSIDVTSELEE